MPEILQGLGRIMEALALPLTMVVLASGAYFIARMWRGARCSEQIEPLTESIARLQAGVDGVRASLDEVHDRLDVAERLLAQALPPRQLPSEADTPV